MAITGVLYNDLDTAIGDVAAATGHIFIWKGQTFPCVLNVESNTLVVSKTGLPGIKVGDVINISGKDRSILAMSNASRTFVPGGYVEPSTSFTDDSGSPSITIHYGALVRG